MIASKHGHTATAQLLIEAHANVDAMNKVREGEEVELQRGWRSIFFTWAPVELARGSFRSFWVVIQFLQHYYQHMPSTLFFSCTQWQVCILLDVIFQLLFEINNSTKLDSFDEQFVLQVMLLQFTLLFSFLLLHDIFTFDVFLSQFLWVCMRMCVSCVQTRTGWPDGLGHRQKQRPHRNSGPSRGLKWLFFFYLFFETLFWGCDREGLGLRQYRKILGYSGSALDMRWKRFNCAVAGP